MVNLASTLKGKVEVLCKPQLLKALNLPLHQRGGCFSPPGPRKVPVIASDELAPGALGPMWAFCFPKDWDY